jgi:GNAT superfamily N-acetyltransferase
MASIPSESDSPIHIRPATLNDAISIASLHIDSWRFAYKNILTKKFLADGIESDRKNLWLQRFKTPRENQQVFIAEEQHQPIGFACVFVNDHEEWGSLLDNIHVSRSSQGKGIGAALISHVAQWCKAQASDSGIYLWVLQDNIAAQRFYHHLGAINAGTGVWIPPEGGSIPRYRFTWSSATDLLTKIAHSSRK